MSTEPVVNPATINLRAALNASNDEGLAKFLYGYSIGFAAGQFIEIMIEPNQRAEFLFVIAKTYPDDWNKTVEALKLLK
jgi:hypothetical protein